MSAVGLKRFSNVEGLCQPVFLACRIKIATEAGKSMLTSSTVGQDIDGQSR